MHLRLKVNNHTDCVILNLAVQAHCRKMEDDYQAAALAALREGNEQKARDYFKYRDQVRACMGRTLARLDRLERRFEDRRGETRECKPGNGKPYDGTYSACPGDVAARDSY